VSASNVWAVGTSFGPGGLAHTLTEHWNGTKWSVVSSPNPGTAYNVLAGVAGSSTNPLRTVGGYGNVGRPGRTFIARWNGSGWTRVTSPNAGSSFNFLYGIANIPGTTGAWAVGIGSGKTLIEHTC
jgi:hypothetical protein